MTVPGPPRPVAVKLFLAFTIALAVGGVLFLGLVLAAGLQLVAPSPADLGAPPASLAGAYVIEISSRSGSVLHGWFLPPARPGDGAVLLAHGYRENRGMMTRRAALLHREGFGVLLFDFQAHGESLGAHITLGALEGLDLAAAVADLHRRLPNERVGAIGVSLGGASILLAPGPLPLAAAVVESAFPSIDSAIRNRLAQRLPAWQVAILAPTLQALMRPVLGVSPADLRPIDVIGSFKTPLLMIAGDQDTRTPIGEARDLFAHASGPKQPWVVPGAGHVDLERYDPAAYWSKVLPFLTEHLRAEDSPRPVGPAIKPL